MTDRVKALTVVLDTDIRTDDIEVLVSAILCMKHVSAVSKSVVTSDDFVNRERIKYELSQKLIEVLYPKKDPP